MKKFLLFMLGALLALPGIARDFTYEYEGQTLTYTVLDEDAKTCKTKDGTSSSAGNNVSGELIIPAVAKDGDVEYSVTSLGDNAFLYCSGLTSVTFPGSLTSIGERAFCECLHLKSVTLPEFLTSIGHDAFSECVNLASVALPESLTLIGNGVFSGCRRLASVTFPKSLTSIGNSTFGGCKGLTSVTLPESLTSIGNYTFYGCSALTSVVIPNSVTSIGERAFSGCSGLTSVVIPNSVPSIRHQTFYGCIGLSSVVIPPSVTSIEFEAFEDCIGLTKSAYPSGLTNPFSKGIAIRYPRKGAIIEDGFVYGADKKAIYFAPLSIEEFVVPNTVSTIEDKAFAYCENLRSLIIGCSVTGIYPDAFVGCGLEKAASPSGLYNPISVVGIAIQYPREGAIIEDGFVYGPEKSAIYFAPISLEGEYAIPNSVTSIGEGAFYYCTDLTEVILPPSVETIGASAFASNNKLTSIIMGHNVKTIGDKAFYRCPAQTVCITAQTPPVAAYNTFSSYTGSLYVQGQEAAKAYSDADYCWYRFEGHVMIEPTELKADGDKTLNGKPGDTFQLTATLYPENVTLPQIFWRSTNPDIATVDANGLVTLRADMSEVMALAEGDDETTRSCKIIAESLYANGPVAEFTVNDVSAGIEDVINDSTPSGDIDYNAPVEIYTLQGVMVGDNTENLTTGIYIVRQGNNVKKIAVK